LLIYIEDFDVPTLEIPMTPEIRVQYHIILQRELPDRIISQVNQDMRNTPEYQHYVPLQRSLSTIIHQAVWNVFENMLPTSLPPREVPETPRNTMSELAATMHQQQLPRRSSSLQSVGAPTPEGLNQNSPITTALVQGQEHTVTHTSISNTFSIPEDPMTHWLPNPSPPQQPQASMDFPESGGFSNDPESSMDLFEFNFDVGTNNGSFQQDFSAASMPFDQS
jgi:hypothetical protein